MRRKCALDVLFSELNLLWKFAREVGWSASCANEIFREFRLEKEEKFYSDQSFFKISFFTLRCYF
ncbi:MAG: hypothetical protein D3925_14165 [Candidatus Electrothrix sp. AR5]|nr:hypothetical protein [Candidatus Electrothrix sp. AR5]